MAIINQAYNKRYVLTGIIIAGLAICTGALGAHAIKSIVGPGAADTWSLGSRYQMIHGISIIILALFASRQSKWLKYAFWFFVAGVILFSGSLYLLSFKSVIQQSALKIIGPLTPLGGISFILGWICFFIGIKKSNNE